MTSQPTVGENDLYLASEVKMADRGIAETKLTHLGTDLRSAANYAARRAMPLNDDEQAPIQVPHLQVAPRRALIERPISAQVPGLSQAQQRTLARARRGAPVRALIDRVFDGFDGSARRGLIDPAEAIVAELVQVANEDRRWGFLQTVSSSGIGSQLDHWVIGPGGVFLLSTKQHPGSRLFVSGDNFLVDGRDEPYVPQLRDQALDSSEQLSAQAHWDVDVTGIIVPVNDRQLTVDQHPYAVEVMGNEGLAAWLLNRREELSKRQIISAFQAARNNAAWGPKFQ